MVLPDRAVFLPAPPGADRGQEESDAAVRHRAVSPRRALPS